MKAQPTTRFRMPAAVWALGWVSLLTDVSTEMVYPLLPVFLTATLGASVAFVGLVEGIAESTASLVKIWSGWRSDRLRQRKPLMIAGYGLSAMTRPLLALASAGWHVLGSRFIDRIGKGIRTAPRDALLAASVPPAERGRAFGLQRSMDHAGAVIGPLLAWVLLQWFVDDYRHVFWVAVLPMIGAMIVLIVGAKEAPRDPLESSAGSEVFIPSIRFRNYLGAVLLFTLGNSSDAFLLLRARDCGVPVSHLPLIWMVLHLIKSASSYPGGLLSDRIGRKGLVVSGWCVYALVYLGFGSASESWHIWSLFAAYGLFHGMTESAEKAWVADFFSDSQRGRAFGLFNAVTGVGALPASLLTGWLWAAFGPTVAFHGGALLALLAALWLFFRVSAVDHLNHHSQPQANQ